MVSHCDEVQYDCIANYGLSSIGMVLKMNKYQVHYEYVSRSMTWVQRGKRTVAARTEAEAVIKAKRLEPRGFGHWIKDQENEVAA